MPETIVLALSGLSPAVITETVWSLLRENKELLPLRVVPITTNTGAELIEKMKQDGIWQQLLESLQIAPELLLLDNSRIITDNKGQAIEDTDSAESHDLTADCMTAIVQEYKKAGHNIIASISGGRKTMGALMYAVMSMLGDMEDRITHVLVDNSILGFTDLYFPLQKKQQLVDRLGNTLQASKVKVNLIDIPFPRFKLISKKPFISDKMSFTNLVQSVNTPDWKEVKITLDIHARQVNINDKSIDFSKVGYPFQILCYIILCNKYNIPMMEYYELQHSSDKNSPKSNNLTKFTDDLPRQLTTNKQHAISQLGDSNIYIDINKAKDVLREQLKSTGAVGSYLAGMINRKIENFKIPPKCIELVASASQKKQLMELAHKLSKRS